MLTHQKNYTAEKVQYQNIKQETGKCEMNRDANKISNDRNAYFFAFYSIPINFKASVEFLFKSHYNPLI